MRSWSNSSLTTLQMCGYKWYRRYIMKDWRPVGFSAKRGSTVHHIAKETHKRQMFEDDRWDGGKPELTELPGSERSVEEAEDLAATQFEKEVDKKGGYAEIPLYDNEKHLTKQEVKAHNKDVAVALSGLYVGQVAPPIKPEAVERKVEIQPKNADFKIQGYIDLVENDLGDVIRDLKTKEKSPYPKEAEVSQQLTLYNMIRYAEKRKMAEAGEISEEDAKLPRESRLVYLVRTPKTHEMKVITQTTTRSMEDIKRLVARIKVAVEAVDKGVFVPADPSAAGSPCGWCEFNDGTCPYFRKEKS